METRELTSLEKNVLDIYNRFDHITSKYQALIGFGTLGSNYQQCLESRPNLFTNFKNNPFLYRCDNTNTSGVGLCDYRHLVFNQHRNVFKRSSELYVCHFRDVNIINGVEGGIFSSKLSNETKDGYKRGHKHSYIEHSADMLVYSLDTNSKRSVHWLHSISNPINLLEDEDVKALSPDDIRNVMLGYLNSSFGARPSLLHKALVHTLGESALDLRDDIVVMLTESMSTREEFINCCYEIKYITNKLRSFMNTLLLLNVCPDEGFKYLSEAYVESMRDEIHIINSEIHNIVFELKSQETKPIIGNMYPRWTFVYNSKNEYMLLIKPILKRFVSLYNCVSG